MYKLLTLSIYLLTHSFFVDAKLRVGVTHWVDYTNLDETGTYIELIKKVYPDEDISFEFTTYKRMTSLFELSRYDFVVGVTKEDVPKAHYPVWHLDFDYPINAYFLKSNTNIKSLKNLNNRVLSWLHGYDFDRYIEYTHDFYPVSTIEKGMSLLTNERIDAFVDFDYNIPNDLKSLLSSIEVLPARPMYLAFSNSNNGMRLAEKFDAEMVKMRDSGKLKQIFRTDYTNAKFEGFQHEKPKVVISTNDESLLRLYNEQVTPSLETQLYKVLLEKLQQYRVEFVKADNVNDETQFAINNCFANKLKTESRNREYLMSSPFSLYMPPRLYSRYDLAKYKTDDLNTLLSNSKLKLGISTSRKVNDEIESLVKKIRLDLVEVASNNVFSRLNELSEMKDFQVSIEYPSDISTYWHQVTGDDIYSIELPINTQYTLGHLMCKKGELNKKFIDDFNVALKQLIHTDRYFKFMKDAAAGVPLVRFTDIYKSAFKH